MEDQEALGIVLNMARDWLGENLPQHESKFIDPIAEVWLKYRKEAFEQVSAWDLGKTIEEVQR